MFTSFTPMSSQTLRFAKAYRREEMRGAREPRLLGRARPRQERSLSWFRRLAATPSRNSRPRPAEVS